MDDLSKLVWSTDENAAGYVPEFLVVNANPDGTIEASASSIAVNPATGAFYVKTAASATSWTSVGGGSTSFANPTASVGPVAVNGVATTAMRSDAAPALANTAVTPGAYTYSAITVDAQGRITAAASGAAPPAAANPTASVGPAAVNGVAATFMRSDAAPALANTAVTPGAYTYSAITVDAQGRITAAASGSGAGRLIGFQVLTGTGTYTPTAGTGAFVVQGVGAGGGGGACDGTAVTLVGAAGGGSGAMFLKRYTSVAASYPFACGAAGAGGAAGPNNGGNGGNTTFDAGGALLTAPGGLGGAFADAATFAPIPGLGAAIATGGDVNAGGQDGNWPFQDGLGTGSVLASGSGAQCPEFGGGGRLRTTDGTGNAATGSGAGGGGAYSTGATDRAGGAGGAGKILVWEYS